MCNKCESTSNLIPGRNLCRVCSNIQRKNSPSYKSRHSGTRINRSDGSAKSDKKKFLDAVRSAPCLDCGGVFPPCAMDFDHVGPKSFGVMSKYGDKTMAELLEEIAKCEIVCSNCHRVRTAARRLHFAHMNDIIEYHDNL